MLQRKWQSSLRHPLLASLSHAATFLQTLQSIAIIYCMLYIIRYHILFIVVHYLGSLIDPQRAEVSEPPGPGPGAAAFRADLASDLPGHPAAHSAGSALAASGYRGPQDHMNMQTKHKDLTFWFQGPVSGGTRSHGW